MSDYMLEYPALSAWLLWAASLVPPQNVYTFYWMMSIFLFAFMLVAVFATRKLLLLRGLSSTSSLEHFIIFTPVFIFYSIYSFDWAGAGLMMLSIYLAYRQRAALSGVSMGLAIAVRIIPAVCLPFILLSFKGRTSRLGFVGAVVGSWLLTNAYFMLRDFQGFVYPYTFQAGYFSEDSWLNIIPNDGLAKVVSGILLVGVLLLLLRLRDRFELGELCFLALVGFLVVSYKFPPQYMILALPLFALAGRSYRMSLVVNILDIMLILWIATPMFNASNPAAITSPDQWIAVARQGILAIIFFDVIRRRLKLTGLMPFRVPISGLSSLARRNRSTPTNP